MRAMETAEALITYLEPKDREAARTEVVKLKDVLRSVE
jgi:hypothetical protein